MLILGPKMPCNENFTQKKWPPPLLRLLNPNFMQKNQNKVMNQSWEKSVTDIQFNKECSVTDRELNRECYNCFSFY